MSDNLEGDLVDAEKEILRLEAERDKMWASLDEFLIEYDNEVARTPSNHSGITMTFARQNDLISMMREARQTKEQPDARYGCER